MIIIIIIIGVSRSELHTNHSYEKITVLMYICMYVCELVCSDTSSMCSSRNCACVNELVCVQINWVKIANVHRV